MRLDRSAEQVLPDAYRNLVKVSEISRSTAQTYE